MHVLPKSLQDRCPPGIPTDIKRLFLFETQPKAFLALSVIRKNLSQICSEPKYMRVKQEWSRHVKYNGHWEYRGYDQMLPDGTIDGICYVSYKGICIDEKSQWRNGLRHGMSDEHFDDKPTYRFYVNGKREGIHREWNYNHDRWLNDNTGFYPNQPSDYFLEYEEFHSNGMSVWWKQYDPTGNVIRTNRSDDHE